LPWALGVLHHTFVALNRRWLLMPMSSTITLPVSVAAGVLE
jgi:hypothetical protein